MNDTQPPNDNDDALAAEYVIGVLDTTERQAAQARARTDAAFAARVSFWEDHLEDLNSGYGTQTPPKRIKKQIDRSLFGAPEPSRIRWLWMGLATAVVVMGMIFYQIFLPAQPDLRAELQSDGSDYAFSVAVDLAASTIDMMLLAGAPATNATFELWLIPEGGVPQSLGTFEPTDQILLSPDVDLAGNQTLAVSLEPLGGSPTGAPTGPVLAVGALEDA